MIFLKFLKLTTEIFITKNTYSEHLRDLFLDEVSPEAIFFECFKTLHTLIISDLIVTCQLSITLRPPVEAPTRKIGISKHSR
jgi:hypothetical protein